MDVIFLKKQYAYVHVYDLAKRQSRIESFFLRHLIWESNS